MQQSIVNKQVLLTALCKTFVNVQAQATDKNGNESNAK